ncbi:MAG: thymidylate synthase ThyX [Prevotella sp.]|nr:thymidylate synthase ThyX [Prevotella sp.]
MSNEFYIFGGDFHNTGANIKQQNIIVQDGESKVKEEQPATPRVVVRRVTSWKEVLNAARFTQRKPEVDHEPSDEFKQKMIKAEHSPLRCLQFTIDFYDIPYYTSVHLCRHVHAQPFVSTSRPDINGQMKPRDEQKKSDPVNMRLLVNAQEIINISRVRLCSKAEGTTRMLWMKAIRELVKIEPFLANACVPNCLYRGFCPEIKPCGFSTSDVDAFNFKRSTLEEI